jgi:hypothetical protein
MNSLFIALFSINIYKSFAYITSSYLQLSLVRFLWYKFISPDNRQDKLIKNLTVLPTCSFCQSLTVAVSSNSQHFPTFCGTAWYTTLFTTPTTGLYSEPKDSIMSLPLSVFQIHLNITHLALFHTAIYYNIMINKNVCASYCRSNPFQLLFMFSQIRHLCCMGRYYLYIIVFCFIKISFQKLVYFELPALPNKYFRTYSQFIQWSKVGGSINKPRFSSLKPSFCSLGHLSHLLLLTACLVHYTPKNSVAISDGLRIFLAQVSHSSCVLAGHSGDSNFSQAMIISTPVYSKFCHYFIQKCVTYDNRSGLVK